MFEPFAVSIIVSSSLVGAGFAAAGLGWYGVARNAEAFIQLPYLLTGGSISLGLIGTGLAILRVQWSRRYAEIERAQLADLTIEAGKILTALRTKSI